MSRSTFFLTLPAAAVALAAAIGCYTGPKTGDGTAGAVDPTEAEGQADTADLPCDVAKVLADNCSSCHGTTPSGGAPDRLIAASDLKSPVPGDPSLNAAQLSVQRMRDTKNPMPPSGPLPPAQIAVLENWIDAGMPTGTCSAAGDTSAADGASTASVCTSGTTWTRGNRGSAEMHPGVACIDCHSRNDGPAYGFAGTVYPTAHEPDDCYGATSSAQVVITDANGKVHTAPIEAAGNFASRDTITPPYTAAIVANGKTRKMNTPQTDGDCNGCHTEKGAKGASGRLTAP